MKLVLLDYKDDINQDLHVSFRHDKGSDGLIKRSIILKLRRL